MPGDLVTARVTYAAPHHLVADELIDIRYRGMVHALGTSGLGLGMPSVGVPRA